MVKKALLEQELILAIDFDGTITTEPQIGKKLELKDDAYEVLHRLHEDGVKLILWTCRTGKLLEEALSFLNEQGLLEVFDTVNEQIPEIRELYKPRVAKKIGADVYIDDKNIFCKEIDWLEIEKFIYGE